MDHTDAALRAVVKTLRDVVAPALDPADPLAHEQLRLAVDYLEFLRGRFEWLHGRERFDLTHHLDMARAMCRIGGPVSARVATALAASIDRGERVIVDPAAAMPALKSTTAALAAAIAAVVQEAAGWEDNVRRDIERCVLAATDERNEFERTWYLPLGFDPAPGEVRKLTEFLAT